MPRLRYLHEAGNEGQGLFVYCCPSCSRILQIRHDMGPLDQAVIQASGRCAGCGRPIEGGFAQLSPKWASAVASAPQPEWKERSLFQRASSISHFCLGFPRLDSLLRPLSVGDFVLFSGPSSSAVAELAAFRAQLPVEAGGFDSGVIYVDGGNRSDPYLFSSFAKQKSMAPAVAMKRVASCRIFTLYQLAAMVSEHLLRAVEDYGTRLVIIADVLGTFNEPELEEREARRVLATIEEGIHEVKKHALVLATLVSPNRYDDAVSSWASTFVRLSSDAGNIRAELVRQRGRPPRVTTFRHNQLLRAAKAGATH